MNQPHAVCEGGVMGETAGGDRDYGWWEHLWRRASKSGGKWECRMMAGCAGSAGDWELRCTAEWMSQGGGASMQCPRLGEPEAGSWGPTGARWKACASPLGQDSPAVATASRCDFLVGSEEVTAVSLKPACAMSERP